MITTCYKPKTHAVWKHDIDGDVTYITTGYKDTTRERDSHPFSPDTVLPALINFKQFYKATYFYLQFRGLLISLFFLCAQ